MPEQVQIRSWRWLCAEASAPTELDLSSGIISACSYKCPEKETVNEDAAIVVELSSDHVILAVADGLGGHDAGDRAARATIEAIFSNCQPTEPSSSLRSSIVDAIEEANREVLSWGVGAGSTLVVAEFYCGVVRIIHVGDAGAVLTSNKGNVKFFAVAHAPVAMAVEIGVLEEMEALTHSDRNVITNCVGSSDMKIEVGPEIAMAKDDTLLLASDGLFDNLTTSEMVNVVRSGNLNEQLTSLVDTIRSRMFQKSGGIGKPDDLTVCCFRQT
ncbi:MAG: PP2C family serine/threonine-protein phosphatase [Mariniblastus sp.]